MRGVRQDSSRQTACGQPRTTPVGSARKGTRHLLRRSLDTTDGRRTTSRRCSGRRRQAHALARVLQSSPRNTASRTTRRARPRSFGSWTEAPAQRLLPREHGIVGSCAAGMAWLSCKSLDEQGPVMHPHRWTLRGSPDGGGDDRVHAGSEGQEGSINDRKPSGCAKG
jgi:hypothetical protein